MNRFISAVVTAVLTMAGMAAAGYFQSRGYVALGDARAPASFIGYLATAFAGFGGLAFGGSVPWKTMASKVVAAAKNATAQTDVQSPDASPSVVGNVTVRMDIDRVDVIPIKAEMLNRCMYHIRLTLKDDADAQELIDKLAVKIGRATASINASKPKAKEEVAS
jgi:hypothetical protein